MDNNGWIKLHRCLLVKPIWAKSTPEQKTILITILMMANHEENEWEWEGKKFTVMPGQFIGSLESIAKKAGVSIKNVRTAIEKFQKYEFLANQSTKTGRLVTVTNWGTYQVKEERPGKDSGKQVAKTRQRPGKQVATNKNDENEIKKEEIPYAEIINHLNKKAKTNYRATNKATKDKINARWNEKFTLEDFKKVINTKTTDWLGTDQEKYLRPETLFGNKFESYLNQRSFSVTDGVKM